MVKETGISSLFQLLLKKEKEFGSQVYLRQPKQGVWHELTWTDVMTQARKLAGFLQELGLKKGSHISIISKNTAEWFITDFGIHLAGMVNVPLFANQSEDSINYILEHAEIQLVFIGKLDDHQKVRSFIPRTYKTIGFDYHLDLDVDYHWRDVLASKPLLELTEPEADALYTIIYSSGTTGSPKGAMYTNQSIAHYLSVFPDDLKTICDLPHYKFVSYLPLAHVYERSAIELASLTINCSVSFIESLNKFAENLQEIQPTLFAAVPRIWVGMEQKISDRVSPFLLNILLHIPVISTLITKKIINNLGFNECKNFFSGASHLPKSTFDFFKALGLSIQEGYGQTENMAYATLSLFDQIKPGYVGSPRRDVNIKLSTEGELLLQGPCFMSGYYKAPEATANAFTADGWLHSGDFAEIDSKNRVKILGRLSENFKNQSGEYIVPARIEKYFETNKLIDQLCLVGQGLIHNVLLVSLTSAGRDVLTRKEVNENLELNLKSANSNLAKYEKISKIIVVNESWTVDNHLTTPTLKIKRKQIFAHYSALVEKVLLQPANIYWE